MARVLWAWAFILTTVSSMPMDSILSSTATSADDSHLLRFPEPDPLHQYGDPSGYRTGYLVIAMFFMSVLGGMIGECLSLQLHATKLTT